MLLIGTGRLQLQSPLNNEMLVLGILKPQTSVIKHNGKVLFIPSS